MFCQQCGNQLPEGAQVCPSCGAKTEKTINFEDVKGFANQKGQELTKSVRNASQDFKQQLADEKEARKIQEASDIFVDPDEKQIAVLGSGYLNNLIHNGLLAKGFGILTDSRFYYRGTGFVRMGKMMYKTDEEKTVDLQDITASGFLYSRNTILAVFSFVLTAIAILLDAVTYVNVYSSWYVTDSDVVLFYLALIGGGIVVLAAWIWFILYKRALYQIFFAGGTISIKASVYGSKELHDFDRQLRQAKDEKLKKVAGERNRT